METVKLVDVYKPHKDSLVVEFISNKKSKAGVILPESERNRLSNKILGWKVLAVGPMVTEYKVDDYVLVNFQDARPVRVPVIYKTDEDEIQHLQFREMEILGKIDEAFVLAANSEKEVVN